MKRDDRCFVVVIYLLFVYAMVARWGGALADDGAFFLRYAENMAQGQFWVWNSGEAPIWGASAPLYPLLIAPLMAFGVLPVYAITGAGVVLGAAALTLTAHTLLRRFGYVAATSFVALACVDSHLMWFCGTAGLETPLSIGILAFGMWALIHRQSQNLVGVAAGLLMVCKIDLIPAAFFLVVALGLANTSMPVRAIKIALGLALAWYLFAWMYFGLPVPNSMVTKALFQNQTKIITWVWFGQFALFQHGHVFLVLLSLGVFLNRSRQWMLPAMYAGGLLVSHVVAYSIKYPFEPYDWYAMPALYCLTVLAALGVASISKTVEERFQKSFLVFFPMVGVLLFNGYDGLKVIDGIKHYLNLERDRASAGAWVDLHTPRDFKVYTYWGNPAFFSKRYVLDGSFLNRRYESVDMLATYRPEVLIVDPPSRPGYTLVRIFNKAGDVGINYPFGVHVRDDLVGKVSNVDLKLRDCYKSNSCLGVTAPLMDFVSNISAGDKFGGVRPERASNTIFVHPGDTQPTAFDLDVPKLAGPQGKPVSISVMMSPEVPPDALERGAANVGVTVSLRGQEVISRRVVKVGAPTLFELPPIQSEPYRFVIDNNGGADTDWVWGSFEGGQQ